MNGNIFIDAQEVANELGTSKAVSYTHLANAELFEIVCRQMIRLYQKIDTLEQ